MPCGNDILLLLSSHATTAPHVSVHANFSKWQKGLMPWSLEVA